MLTSSLSFFLFSLLLSPLLLTSSESLSRAPVKLKILNLCLSMVEPQPWTPRMNELISAIRTYKPDVVLLQGLGNKTEDQFTLIGSQVDALGFFTGTHKFSDYDDDSRGLALYSTKKVLKPKWKNLEVDIQTKNAIIFIPLEVSPGNLVNIFTMELALPHGDIDEKLASISFNEQVEKAIAWIKDVSEPNLPIIFAGDFHVKTGLSKHVVSLKRFFRDAWLENRGSSVDGTETNNNEGFTYITQTKQGKKKYRRDLVLLSGDITVDHFYVPMFNHSEHFPMIVELLAFDEPKPPSPSPSSPSETPSPSRSSTTISPSLSTAIPFPTNSSKPTSTPSPTTLPTDKNLETPVNTTLIVIICFSLLLFVIGLVSAAFFWWKRRSSSKKKKMFWRHLESDSFTLASLRL